MTAGWKLSLIKRLAVGQMRQVERIKRHHQHSCCESEDSPEHSDGEKSINVYALHTSSEGPHTESGTQGQKLLDVRDPWELKMHTAQRLKAIAENYLPQTTLQGFSNNRRRGLSDQRYCLL